MSRKNRNAGQPNRQAQMSRRVRHRTASSQREYRPQEPVIHLVKTREESMAAHPAGKALVSVSYALDVNGG